MTSSNLGANILSGDAYSLTKSVAPGQNEATEEEETAEKMDSLGDDSGRLTPSCLRWASKLSVLLNDKQGLSLFQHYLEEEDPERYNMLEFWLACKGLSKQPPEQAHKLVYVIYTHLFNKGQFRICENVTKEVNRKVINSKTNNTPLPADTFKDACVEVERVMNEVMYPNFLHSDVYLDYVQKVQIGERKDEEELECDKKDGGENSPRYGEGDIQAPLNISSQPLPVVDEDSELTLTLTEDSLVATEQSRLNLSRRQRELLSGRYPHYSSSVRRVMNPYHVVRRLHRPSYNPVSRQESELQSLSSDARTDSMSDVSMDGVPCSREQRSAKQQTRRHRVGQKDVIINQNVDSHTPMIPKTQRLTDLEKKKDCHLDANVLNQKLEEVLKQREKCDILDYSSDDDILEKHVNQSIQGLTPKDTGSPNRMKSVEVRRTYPQAYLPPIKFSTSVSVSHAPPPYSVSGPPKPKHKNMGSLFSLDSGNGTDPAEGVENRNSLTKSKSVPNYSFPNEYAQSPTAFHSGHAFPGRGVSWSGSRKTLNEDSGVSVISGDYHENPPSQPPPIQYREKITYWLTEQEHISAGSVDREQSSLSSKHKSRSVGCATAYDSFRNKSGYAENRPSSSGKVKTSHMPQLEDACRRLIEDQQQESRRSPTVAHTQCPVFYSQMGRMEPLTLQKMQYPARTWKPEECASKSGPKSDDSMLKGFQSLSIASGSSGSSSGRTQATVVTPVARPKREENYTTVVYNFRDEEVPYRSKIPGNPITLKQFKDFMPRKGHFRYFFMTACEEFENKQVKEEITDDNQLLPLWKGKVMAQIESME